MKPTNDWEKRASRFLTWSDEARGQEQIFRMLSKLRDVKIWAVREGIHPVYQRQALVMMCELERIGALSSGNVDKEDLDELDSFSIEEARKAAEMENESER